MRSGCDWTRLILLILLLGLAWSCAQPKVKPPEGSFYVTPEITYLLDGPRYGGNVVGSLYRGDQVEFVDAGESNWWRVELRRSGQTGWVQKELLSSEPVSPVFYYVNEDTLSLRECPRSDCLALQLLFRGDQVQRVEEGDQGWWRVLMINSRSLGWVPAAALTERLEEAQQKPLRKPYYYVAVVKMSLRGEPSNRGDVIRTLRFNDQVEKIGQTNGWFKVRQPSSGAVGWVLSRDLETLPLVSPRGRGPVKDELKPFKQREEPLVEPEFM
jgi:uncharacterized protein YgiM (DUF1202 family)